MTCVLVNGTRTQIKRIRESTVHPHEVQQDFEIYWMKETSFKFLERKKNKRIVCCLTLNIYIFTVVSIFGPLFLHPVIYSGSFLQLLGLKINKTQLVSVPTFHCGFFSYLSIAAGIFFYKWIVLLFFFPPLPVGYIKINPIKFERISWTGYR